MLSLLFAVVTSSIFLTESLPSGSASLAPKESRAIPQSPLMKTQPLVGSFAYLHSLLTKSPSFQPVCNKSVLLRTAIEDSLASHLESFQAAVALSPFLLPGGASWLLQGSITQWEFLLLFSSKEFPLELCGYGISDQWATCLPLTVMLTTFRKTQQKSNQMLLSLYKPSERL